EETTAAYIELDLAGERWDANVGLRLVKTQTTAQAWDAKILSVVEFGAFNYSAVYDEPSSVYQESEYTYALPTANFTWRCAGDLRLRRGAAKTMARPAVSQLAPTNTTESVSWGEFAQIYGGNAELEPYSAEQADASLEWYFAENSIANF